ncbi:MAG TPA: hypothetical protein VFH73_11110 [Polyangia bacterium]|jgi:TolA-binding protein|nr:hypothetical protein [Polyangia bacterium]
MMTGRENPGRLAQNPSPASREEANAAKLLRVLQASPSRLLPSARARIVARLDHGDQIAAGGRSRAVLPFAVAAALVLFAGGAVGAAWGLPPARRLFNHLLGNHLLGSTADPPPPRATTPGRATTPSTPAPAPAAAPTPPFAPELVPIPTAAFGARRAGAAPRAVSLAHAPTARRSGPASSRSTDGEAVAEDPVVAESRLLAQALAALRQERDPQRALHALDQYDRRFPSGSLSPEATAARIDALLALGRKGPALARLEALSFDRRLPRAAEMQVLRAELRAGRGNLTGAVDDFDATLASPGAPATVIERALYGRSSCRSRMGDLTGARSDLHEYMRRFPRGQFAGPAGQALAD